MTAKSEKTSRFDTYLNQVDGEWQWTLPQEFNITQACVCSHVASGNGDNIALIVEDHALGTKQLSYQSLDEQSARLANALSSNGIVTGDRVLIRLPNSTDYPVSFFGCIRQGAIAVPTSTLLAASEVAYLAKDSGAKVLIAAKSMWQELKSLLDEDTQLEAIYLAGPGDLPESPQNSPVKLCDFEQLLVEASAQHQVIASSPHDPAYLVYTSGTTGYPKGVLHAHRSLIGRLPASRYWFDFKPGDRIMHSGKFNWTYVLGSALMDPLFHGQTVIVHEGPNDANTWPELIKKHNCTIFIGVPTIYRQIIQKTQFGAKDVPSLRHCMSAGEHLSDEMLLAWRDRFEMDVYEAIGMSEFSYYISQHRGAPIKPGAAGFPQPGHNVMLLDGEGEPSKPGEEGMIAIPENDPGLFLNYWQLPEETEKARHDGYFFTGDYARMDAEGYIWFLGRKDDIINTFGYRVSPHEIERVIKTHPKVADCVALGEDIAKDKTLVSICVIPVKDSELTESELLEFGSQQLAKYKAPKIAHLYDDFPRTKNGKVLRKQMLQQLAEIRAQQEKGETA
ncbi:acyl-CoA synthetase [Aliikangiella sp. G2MR2-5]|uniref:acyl-CoA synthetase n=1 Tax=Aliikangiella sp. G2MR2-5 TaxID=2788943 RepID=UPI0018ABA8B1|nr:acyl-CoA synthetase [Aliikangiella sp. G2MR2-5]